MNDSGPDPARHKAVLAAVLAVQRGFLSPDEAVRVLAELNRGGPTGLADPPARAVMDTLLSVAPTSAKTQIEADVESLVDKPETLAATLSEMGLNAEAQSSLFALKPDTSSEAATRALSSIADKRARVRDMTSRLSSGSGRYVVRREFARGGMGLIYVALDNAVGREVALKELLPPKMGEDGTAAPELVERFLREAKVTGQLEHPNIVPVYEIATRDDGSVFYTMKLVHGRTMAHRLMQIQNGSGSEQEKLAERLKLLDAFSDVCNAIAYAHSRGVIHRDIKPANIMLGDFGETMMLDWGLARVRGQEDSSTVRKKAERQAFSPSLLQDDSQGRTLDGAVLGTPAYMPPEQARGELDKVDERADVYALGAILYEILSGQPPYEGSNARDILAKVLVLEPQSLKKTAPLAPPDLVSLAEKAMARELEQRLESAEALGREVLAFRDGRTLSVYRYSSTELIRRFVRRHRAAVAVACVALLLIFGGAAYAFQNIANERDQAQSALETATRERTAREELERKQKDERAQLIRVRQDEIRSQRSHLRDLRGGNLADEAGHRIVELKQRGTPEGGLSPGDRSENARIVSGLLEDATARTELIRLLTAPVAGRSHEFVSPDVLDAERKLLRDNRLLAAELALLNDDFALADFIVEGTDADRDVYEDWKQRVETARTALLARHRETIEGALDDVRQGLARQSRPRGNVRLEDYVLQLSAYRETQTVQLLGAALKPFIEKAKTENHDTLWTQAERDEITLACRVLGYVELPELATPHLAAFMAEIQDMRLAIECATALCQTAHHVAYPHLVAARARFGHRSYIWGQVVRWLDRVPEPPGLAEPSTAEEYADRGWLRREQKRNKEAMADAEAALLLEPENLSALLLKATGLGTDKRALEVLEAAITLAPEDARAYQLRASVYRATGRNDDSVRDARKAVELDPDNARTHLTLGFVLGFGLDEAQEAIACFTRAIELDPYLYPCYANRAAVYCNVGEYQLAIGDATRSLELNPYHPEAYNNRAVARIELGDYQGAIEDLTRMLEVLPSHAWAYLNRGQARLKLKQYEGAIEDLTFVVNRMPGNLPHAFRFRGEAYAALDKRAEALADYQEYLHRVPEADDRAEVEALIAKLEE